MAMQTLSADSGDVGSDDRLSADINTTPLVDVMLVLLIIFLITVPAVTQSVPVALPRERIEPLAADVQAITLAVDRDGTTYWGAEALSGMDALRQRLALVAAQAAQRTNDEAPAPAAAASPGLALGPDPAASAAATTAARPRQLEVHLRADEGARWDAVAAVHRACVEAGITRVGFITDPSSARGTTTR
jgi:biopolymer transport protein ExbD